MKKILFCTILSSFLSAAAFGAGKHGMGVTLGYESTLGQAVTYHYLMKKKYDFFGGLGFNNSGPKIGGGGTYMWFWNKDLGMRFGSALVISTGGSGEVALEAKFTPEGLSESEDIEASKTYEISSAVMLNNFVGMFWNLTRSFGFVGDITYNAVLSGNEVTLDDEIQYSRDVEATNHSAFEEEFNEKAEDKAKAGGLGFNFGVRFLF